ncbi:MAG: ATP-grasp domain-containing protein, partial [Athalassotoga sp.]
MKKIRILLGSCGGLTGLYLSKLFRKSDYADFEIYGFDAESKNPTKFFVDKFFTVPNASNEEIFLNSLINLLNKEKIDIYFPLHSKEIRVVSKFEDRIRNSTDTK